MSEHWTDAMVGDLEDAGRNVVDALTFLLAAHRQGYVVDENDLKYLRAEARRALRQRSERDDA